MSMLGDQVLYLLLLPWLELNKSVLMRFDQLPPPPLSLIFILRLFMLPSSALPTPIPMVLYSPPLNCYSYILNLYLYCVIMSSVCFITSSVWSYTRNVDHMYTKYPVNVYNFSQQTSHFHQNFCLFKYPHVGFYVVNKCVHLQDGQSRMIAADSYIFIPNFFI